MLKNGNLLNCLFTLWLKFTGQPIHGRKESEKNQNKQKFKPQIVGLFFRG